MQLSKLWWLGSEVPGCLLYHIWLSKVNHNIRPDSRGRKEPPPLVMCTDKGETTAGHTGGGHRAGTGVVTGTLNYPQANEQLLRGRLICLPEKVILRGVQTSHPVLGGLSSPGSWKIAMIFFFFSGRQGEKWHVHCIPQAGGRMRADIAKQFRGCHWVQVLILPPRLLDKSYNIDGPLSPYLFDMSNNAFFIGLSG